MIRMQTSYAAKLLGCEAPAAGAEFTGITTDSRAVEPGMLFAALSGQTYDGHDYVEMALQNGARAVLFQQQQAKKPEHARQSHCLAP